MINITGIDHVVLWVADVERSKHFYTDVLGMEVESENDTRVMMRTSPAHRIGLYKRLDGKEIGFENEMHHVGFTVPAGATREEIKAELQSKGLAVWAREGDPSCIYFIDPDGHDLQIHIRDVVYGARE